MLAAINTQGQQRSSLITDLATIRPKVLLGNYVSQKFSMHLCCTLLLLGILTVNTLPAACVWHSQPLVLLALSVEVQPALFEIRIMNRQRQKFSLKYLLELISQHTSEQQCRARLSRVWGSCEYNRKRQVHSHTSGVRVSV